MPAITTTTSSLLNELTPAMTPARSQYRPWSRRTARIAQSGTAGHTTRSRDAVTSRCVRVVPAMSQAEGLGDAVSADLAGDEGQERQGSDGAQSSGTIRSALTVSPNRATAASARSGVNGGWSVYPHAGGSMRKYGSSRW